MIAKKRKKRMNGNPLLCLLRLFAAIPFGKWAGL